MTDLQDCFNKHIDWKKYNLILDILTQYEDRGHRFIVNIMVGDTDLNGLDNYILFEYDTQDDIKWYDAVRGQIDEYIKLYEKFGMFFVIFTNAHFLNTLVDVIGGSGKFNSCINYKEKYVICK